MTAQLLVLLANQRLNADQYGDADRIAWWANRDTTPPERH